MKPRRWYSSPEVRPQANARSNQAFPAAIQLAYAARTQRQQGPIIKTAPADPPPAARREAQAPSAAPSIRRINAA
jgi:hypothetical protein